MTTKQVIFVRGGRTRDLEVWRYFHFHPTKEIKVGQVKLVYFDYPEGKKKIWKSWLPKRGNPPTRPPDLVEDITPSINIRFDNGSIDMTESLPSVLGLYDYVKKQPKGSVASLQVFSHGDYDGPIIWRDSFEDVDKDDFSLDRDPHDTEFRRRDFFGQNPLAGAEGTKFAQAFAAGAFVKIWGCTADSKYRVMIRRYNRLRGDKKNDVKRLAILENYLDIVNLAYALLLSRLINQVVWSAPIGWGTNPWGKQSYVGKFPPDLKRELWWRVPAFVGSYRRFYTKILGANIDITYYVGFHQSWFKKAKAMLQSSP